MTKLMGRTSPALCGAAIALALLAGALPATAHAAGASRTWVSGEGDDANPCSRTAPCKTFAGAISKTEENGVIDALNPGGFGAVTITEGITIDGTGTNASILVAGTNGVTVDAPGKEVVLNDLDIDGTGGATQCSGLNGIELIAAKSLRVTGVTIEDFKQNAILAAPTGASSTLMLQDVNASQGCGAGNGVTIAPGGSFGVTAMLDGVTLTNLSTGLSVGAGGQAYLADSTVFGNTLGLETSGGGTIESLGGNYIAGNATNGSPTTTVSNLGPAGPAGATGATGPAGPAGKVGKVSCRLRKRRVIKCKVSNAGKSPIKASLSRRGRLLAVGHGGSTIRLRARQALTHGTYRLTLSVAGTKTSRAVHL